MVTFVDRCRSCGRTFKQDPGTPAGYCDACIIDGEPPHYLAWTLGLVIFVLALFVAFCVNTR